MPRSWSVAAASLLLASCNALSGISMYESTAPDPGDGGAVFSVVTSSPANNAQAVPLDATITLGFSDFPDPSSTTFPAITLRSTGSYDFRASVDLIGRTVRIQPRSPLFATTQYAVILTTGVRSLGGAHLDHGTVVSFVTGSAPAGAAMGPPVRTWAHDVAPILAGCLAPGCHDSPSSGSLLLLPDVALANLLDVPASQVARLPRVKPGDASSSYLLRKLLGTPDIAPARMPSNGPPLPTTDLSIISDWINGGALP